MELAGHREKWQPNQPQKLWRAASARKAFWIPLVFPFTSNKNNKLNFSGFNFLLGDLEHLRGIQPICLSSCCLQGLQLCGACPSVRREINILNTPGSPAAQAQFQAKLFLLPDARPCFAGSLGPAFDGLPTPIPCEHTFMSAQRSDNMAVSCNLHHIEFCAWHAQQYMHLSKKMDFWTSFFASDFTARPCR